MPPAPSVSGRRCARSSILTLALGLGANAAVFENIDALILRPFTIHDVDRVVMLAETSPTTATGGARQFRPPTSSTGNGRRTSSSGWRHSNGGMSNLAAVDDPERVSGFLVSADFFPALGVHAGARADVHGRRRNAGAGTGARSSGTISGSAGSQSDPA